MKIIREILGRVFAVWGIIWFVLTMLIFLTQLALSRWWLNHFQFGPMEWLWRTLTYGKRQPMRR